MNKKQLIFNLLISLSYIATAFAYMEDYPPHKFMDGKFKHLEINPIVNYNNSDYVSSDKQIVAKLYEDSNTFNFLLKDGNTVLLMMDTWKAPMPYEVYQVDLNKDDLKDFIVFSSSRGCGLSAAVVTVNIFLKRSDGSYQGISYETMNAGLEDFLDLDNDDKYEVIKTDLYRGDKHNYWVYNIYEIKDYKLINANADYQDFPKFIWYTYKPNDKDTGHLTQKEKDAYINKINSGIKYEEVK